MGRHHTMYQYQHTHMIWGEGTLLFLEARYSQGGGGGGRVLCVYLTAGVIVRHVDVHLISARFRFQFVLVRIGDAVGAADGRVDERDDFAATRARAVLL